MRERDPEAEKLIPAILVIWRASQPSPRAIFAEKLDQFSLFKVLAFHAQMMAPPTPEIKGIEVMEYHWGKNRPAYTFLVVENGAIAN